MTSKRRFEDWHDAFMEYTEHLASTPMFRKWTGISLIAAALERKTWVFTLGQNLYPNLYIALVAPPGIGKTVLTSTAQQFFLELPKHHLSPSAMSRASMADALREAERHVVRPTEHPPTITFNSMYIVTNELSSLIPAYDNDFMGTLTELYDGKRYREKKRGKDLEYTLKDPQLNLLVATTPSYLNEIMPEGAWDQGFISRVIMVYSGMSEKKDLFAEDKIKVEPFRKLVTDYKSISELYGKMGWTEDAAAAITKWYKANNPPVPDHPKLIWYNTRRTAQVLKLCQVASASRGDDLVITLEDYERALDWLLEVEAEMSDIFKSMQRGGDARAIEDTWHYCYQVWVRTKKPVEEVQLWNFLLQRVPSHNIDRVIKAMVTSGLLEKQLNAYKPLVRNQPGA